MINIKKRPAASIGLGLALLAASPALQAQSSKTWYTEPGISPDGTTVAFVSGGDIWEVPVTGGQARLLVAHQANESRPLFSPDGKHLAFMSTRTGNGDVYVLSLADGTLKRLTASGVPDEPSGWSADGRYVYFHNTAGDIAKMNDVYRVSIDGGTPTVVSGDRYVNEFFAAPSPDNEWVALSARGISDRQWWRKGSSHLDYAEIWLLRQDQLGEATAYRQLTASGARDNWPLWANDGQSLYYISDRGGQENFWSVSLDGESRQQTQFSEGRVLWPTIDGSGKTIVFEHGFGLWKLDIASGETSEIPVTPVGTAAGYPVKHLSASRGFSNMAVAPDGKKVAFLFHGRVFLTSVADGGNALPVTTGDGIVEQLHWNPGSDKLAYVALRNGKKSLFQYDFTTNEETVLADGPDVAAALFSPDGKWLAYIGSGRELRLINTQTGKDELLQQGHFGNPVMLRSSPFAWSPDSRWIAFAAYGEKSLSNVSVIPVAGGDPIPVSFLANSRASSISWHPDGKSIYFLTGQRTEDTRIAKVDLVPPAVADYAEDRLRALFTDGETTGKKDDGAAPDVTIEPEGIRSRLQLLPVDLSASSLTISNDGKNLLIGASVAGQAHLFTYPAGNSGGSLQQLTGTGGRKSQVAFSADGKQLYYMERGQMYVMSMESRKARAIAAVAELDVDFDKEKTLVAEQAWYTQKEGFYDENFHGADWDGVYRTYQPYAAGVRTPAELYRLLNMMVGELNASHSGITGATDNSAAGPGQLGLRFDRAEYEESGRLKVTEVVAHGPAALSGKVKPGDYLLAINGTALDSRTNLDLLMENKTGRKTVLTIGGADGKNAVEAAVSPVTMDTEKSLLYRQWVEEQRAYVEKISNGRLGYIHMFDMSAESLDQLYVDLDAQNINKEGIVVDVRNNNGGFVNAYALDVFARKGYMTMTTRGLPPAPARTQLGQRAYGAPTILVTNQHSLSDAEDFTEGYRTLGLGKVVGEPTGGWIIYTSAATLIDGASMRLPFSRITDHEGKTMELAPRPVDIEVKRPVGESYSGTSVQLDRAVETLLEQLDGTN